jgi:dethiobiotin synthetase
VQPKIVFITGTDTGVGKTVLTGLLISHLRQEGFPAIAIKPFCSGGRGDAKLLHSLQSGTARLNEVNPFYFREPLAPLIAARLKKRKVPFRKALKVIQGAVERLPLNTNEPPSVHKSRTPFLLIEGAGGLLAPLGEPLLNRQSSGSRSKRSTPYSALNLILALSAGSRRSCGVHVIVVAANRLGAINHTLLTVQALENAGIQDLTIALMNLEPGAAIATRQVLRTNPATIRELLSPLRVFSLPFLGKAAAVPGVIRSPPPKIHSILRSVLRLRSPLISLQSVSGIAPGSATFRLRTAPKAAP